MRRLTLAFLTGNPLGREYLFFSGFSFHGGLKQILFLYIPESGTSGREGVFGTWVEANLPLKVRTLCLLRGESTPFFKRPYFRFLYDYDRHEPGGCTGEMRISVTRSLLKVYRKRTDCEQTHSHLKALFRFDGVMSGMPVNGCMCS